jgi:N-acetylglucosaminyldiphosphoundecaprenol N-acetyl-beta-D-mannosaminyltransferase
MPIQTLDIAGMQVARIDSSGLVDHIFDSLTEGRGGWVVTANLDILRRHFIDAEARVLYDASDLRVADGMPLVWASRLQGEPLPERVAGSSLLPVLGERAAAEGRSLYFLGGVAGAAEGARDVLVARHPGLRIVGLSSPMVSSPITDEELIPIVEELRRTEPDIVLIGLGSPKQEHVARRLRPLFPRAWFMGIGISFSFVAGHVNRAPEALQRSGLEWVHRMVQEPRRLGRRYLLENLPFAAILFGEALRRRWSRAVHGAE